MRLKNLGLALVPSVLLLVSQVSADEKWSWGKSEDKSTGATARLSSTRKADSRSQGEKRAINAKTSPQSQGRTLGLFDNIGCRIGIGGCSKLQKNAVGRQFPLVPGPFPILPGQFPPFPTGPVPIGPFPGGPLPIGPFPGGPLPIGPFPGGPLPIGPIHGGHLPIGPIPGGHLPIGPIPGGHLPIGPIPGGHLPIGPPHGGHLPIGPPHGGHLPIGPIHGGSLPIPSPPILPVPVPGPFGKPPHGNQLPHPGGYPPVPSPHPVGFPPGLNPHPVKEHIKEEHVHHHTHTHVHEDNGVSPYKLTGYPPIKPGKFSPTVIVSDPHKGQGQRFPGHSTNGVGIKPSSGFPDLKNPIFRPPSSFYEQECQCVLPHQCPPYDIVKKTGGRDISYLLNPRSETHSSILSNATTYAKPNRGKRNVLITNRQPKAASSQTPKGRAIGGFTPGLSGCEYNYVCCRSSDHGSQRTHTSCGKSLKSSIHGRVATPDYDQGITHFGEYPWQAAILKDEDYKSIFVCGATLVSTQHVLTAAHCIADEPYTDLKIRLGEWDVNSESEFYKHVEFPVQNIAIHPQYYPGNLNNDIAIIAFQGYIDFRLSPHISPVCLPSAYSEFTHKHCVVTGWGKDAFGNAGDFQQVLKEVEVPVVDRQRCQYALQEARLGRDYYLPDGFICAGGEKGKDTCEGDGGGPLVCPTGHNTYELAGIVSWGIGCGLAGVPGVYVNIPYYVDWINQHIKF